MLKQLYELELSLCFLFHGIVNMKYYQFSTRIDQVINCINRDQCHDLNNIINSQIKIRRMKLKKFEAHTYHLL